MRLQALSFIGALAVTAIPLSAGAQSLPANDQPVPNAEVYARSAEACPAGLIWEPAGYLSSGKWRPAIVRPATLSRLDGIAGKAGRKAAPRYPHSGVRRDFEMSRGQSEAQ